ncbi:rho GTPase-activating protein 19-like [Dreissena polymorpha]|uniref:rho GTPase-activating protein 19-like n=1 Tax=Dreissena polymorpha TaxID=45954 RepID=UPI0022651AAC|nr:rho GTPase-activating protein 19-like [Dreissena polymorpha]
MPEKLATFCKIHLSFLLELDGSKLEEIFAEQGTNDLNANKRKLSMPFSRKKDRAASSPAPLSSDLLDAMSCLISFLQQPDCLRTEGLFRKTGNVSRQRLLREWIAQGADDLHLGDGTFSPHDVATVLKQLLIELPEPLLTQKHYEAHMQISELSLNCLSDADKKRSDEKHVKALQFLVQLLPRENAALLESLLDLLNQATKVAENKMSAESLGIIFAPSLICPRKLAPEAMQDALATQSKAVAMMIENSGAVFEVPRELADDVAHFWRVMEDVLDGSKSCEDRVNIRKSMYINRSRPASAVLTYADRKSPETFDCAQDTHVFTHDQSTVESVECESNQKLMKQLDRVDSRRNHYRKNGKHSRSRSIGASIKKHLLRKSKSQELCDSQSGEELGSSITKATSIDSVDSISFNETLDNKLAPLLRHNPAVHIVDLEASPRKVRPYSRLINENIDDEASDSKSQYRPPTPCKILLPNTPLSSSRPVAVVYPITKMTDRLPDVLL